MIGSEAVAFFSSRFDLVIGIDNDMRQYFFGSEASTGWNVLRLEEACSNFRNHTIDIRDEKELDHVFAEYGSDIALVVHTAAQPSHDWASKEPKTDFTINANGTLNLLEATRQYSPEAAFIFTSTNKVYGDTPNKLPLVEMDTRWEIAEDHPYRNGIDEGMSLDHTTHSLFGSSKVAADVMVQEYGRYFGMNTVTFRGGCLTGPLHSGAQMHGFLSYLMKCAITGDQYTIFGYKGKQVRDNIHSHDLVTMFWHYYENPRPAAVYNAGGSRYSNCSVIEAISLCEEITGKKMNYRYSDSNRIGDHVWYVSDISSFRSDFPTWEFRYNLSDTLTQIFEALRK